MHTTFPFRIGITGHRTLSDTEQLHVRQEIKHTLKEVWGKVNDFRTQNGINTEYYFSGISPLAEGADRIFAQEILVEGGKLEVVLPFKAGVYQHDFNDLESVAEFYRLLAYDKYPLIIDGGDKPHKEWAYYHAGTMVVDQCDILIAVWNGADAKGAGGTKNIIDYAKKSALPVITIRLDGERQTEHFRTNHIDFAEYLAFNKQWAKQVQKPVTDNCSGDDFSAFKHKIGTTDTANLAAIFNAFDAWNYAAMQHQKLHKRMITGLYALAAFASIMGISTLLLEHRLGEKILLAFHFVEAGALVSILLMFAYIKNSSKHKKWIQSRIWAEKARLQIFETICIRRQSEVVDENLSAALYLNKSWYSRWFLSVVKSIKARPYKNLSLTERTDILRNYLINNQLDFHETRLTANEKLTCWLHTINVSLFTAAILSVAVEISIDVLLSIYKNLQLHTAHQVFGAVIVLIPIGGALIEGYKGMIDHEKAMGMNKNMKARLTSLLTDMEHFCTTDEELMKMFEKIESAMLFENNEWVFIIKDPEPTI